MKQRWYQHLGNNLDDNNGSNDDAHDNGYNNIMFLWNKDSIKYEIRSIKINIMFFSNKDLSKSME